MRIGPLLLTAICVALHLPSEARGQSPDSIEVDATNSKLRELYEEGLKLSSQQHWDKAYASFLAAWKIKRQYQLAGNLGTAEYMLGRFRDAAEHIDYFLREAPEGTTPDARARLADDRKRGQGMLDDARKKIGSVTVTVNREGADVSADGRALGKSPLAGVVFVDPGTHEWTATLEGYAPAKETIALGAGASRTIDLRLVPMARSSVETGSSRAGVASGGGSESRTVAALVTGGLGLVSAVTAGVSYAKAVSADSDVQNLSGRLTGATTTCTATPSPDCRELSDAVDRRKSAYTTALWTGAGAVVFGAATAGVLLLWPTTPARSGIGARMIVAPSWEKGGASIGVSGTF